MLLAGLLLSAQAVAFEPSTNGYGNEIAWEVMPVHWAYLDEGRPENLSEFDAHHAVRKAFSTWNAVPGASVQFIEADASIPEDQINYVYWEPEWSWSADILALTSTWSRPRGEILAFSIGINGEDPRWSTKGANDAMDLQNAVTHEVGHAIGLGHDPAHREATMAPTAGEGETRKRDLHRSDEDGARALYPGQQTGLHCSATQAPPSLLWTLALGVLVALGGRRRGQEEGA